MTRDLPAEAPVRRTKRSAIWLVIWAVVAIGMIGNLSIVAYLFLGHLLK